MRWAFVPQKQSQRFYEKRGGPNTPAATVDVFLSEARHTVDAITFFGHSVIQAGQGSVGLWFPTADPSSTTQVALLGSPAVLPSYPHRRIVPKIATQARVVFIGSCENGPAFRSLWDIDQSTPDRALVTSPTPNVRQGVAAEAWLIIFRDLVAGASLQSAVQHANTEIPIRDAAGAYLPDVRQDGLIEQWQVTGGENGAKVRFR